MTAGHPMRKPGVIARRLGDDTLLYDPGTGSVHVINAMAWEVWNRCDGAIDVEHIERDIRDLANVPQDANVQADVHAVLDQFARQGLLEASDA